MCDAAPVDSKALELPKELWLLVDHLQKNGLEEVFGPSTSSSLNLIRNIFTPAVFFARFSCFVSQSEIFCKNVWMRYMLCEMLRMWESLEISGMTEERSSSSNLRKTIF